MLKGVQGCEATVQYVLDRSSQRVLDGFPISLLAR
jgi:hypothetical protein